MRAPSSTGSSGVRPPSAPSSGMGREGESDVKLRMQQARATSAAPGGFLLINF